MTTLLLTILVAFLVLLMAITAMAIGVMNGRKPISGSCGGLNGEGCSICGGSGECQREAEQ